MLDLGLFVMNRPYTTLFLLQSLDGKISTGSGGERDFDQDLPTITNLKEGIGQYYALEQQTDLVSVNSGKTQAKVGVNRRDPALVKASPVSFVLIDNKPHLDIKGCEYFARKSKTFFLLTNNPQHPAFGLRGRYANIEILFYAGSIDFQNAFSRLNQEYGIDSMTIQTGGTLNSLFIRENLIDRVRIVIAPCLVGGKDTPSLMDGRSLQNAAELSLIKTLTLTSCKRLKDNYLLLEYDVLS